MVLPTEVIHNVLSFLDPRDLIRLSEVSKQFHAVINDPAVWRTLYRNARLPRPPGPFPWQSLRFLQRTLVRSARLAETWTSHDSDVCLSAYTTLPPRSRPHDLQKWVCGRWVFVSIATKRIVAIDFETDHQQLVWDDGRLSRWTACSIISAQGHFIYLVLCTGDGNDEATLAVKLLEFRVADDDSGHLSAPTIFDVPLKCSAKPALHAISTDAPFVYISTVGAEESRLKRHRGCVFDIRSRIFYKFPRFNSQLDEVGQPPMDYNCTREILVTTTHIVALSSFSADDNGERQLVQAFAIPDDPLAYGDGSRELRLSHEAIQHGALSNLSLVRKPNIDPVSGSTTLRFLHIRKSAHMKITVLFTDFTLPKSGTDDVLSIAIDTHTIFSIQGFDGGSGFIQVSVSGGGVDRVPCFVQASDDGFVRGLLVEDTITENISVSEGVNRVSLSWNHHIRKFSLDATGDRCTAVVGDASSASYAQSLRCSEPAAFDGTRGLIGFTEASRLPDGTIEEVIQVYSIT